MHWNILIRPQQGDTGWPADQPGWEIHPPTVQTHDWNTKRLNYCTLWSWKGTDWHLTKMGLFKPVPGTAFPAAGGWTEGHGWWRLPFIHRPRKQFPNFLKALWLPSIHLSPKFAPLFYQKALNHRNTGKHLDTTCHWPMGRSKIFLNIQHRATLHNTLDQYSITIQHKQNLMQSTWHLFTHPWVTHTTSHPQSAFLSHNTFASGTNSSCLILFVICQQHRAAGMGSKAQG